MSNLGALRDEEHEHDELRQEQIEQLEKQFDYKVQGVHWPVCYLTWPSCTAALLHEFFTECKTILCKTIILL